MQAKRLYLVHLCETQLAIVASKMGISFMRFRARVQPKAVAASSVLAYGCNLVGRHACVPEKQGSIHWFLFQLYQHIEKE